MEKDPGKKKKNANESVQLTKGQGHLWLYRKCKDHVADAGAERLPSSQPVHERIKRMEDTGVILQYATLVDHSKVKKGLMVSAGVSLKVITKSKIEVKTIQ